MLARVIAIATCLSVRLSVRPSRASIVSKRRKLAAWFLHHLVAPWLVFWRQISSPNSKGFPRTGASKKGRLEKFSDFLALSVNISKTVADTAKVTISEIGSHTWAFDWHHDRWPWMTLNCCEIKFCRNFAWFRDFGRQPRLHEWR